MNLAALAPQWLVVLLVVLLLGAAVEDTIRLRISNLTCIAIFAAGIAAMALVGPTLALWQNFVVFVGLLVAGTPLFAAGKMGGGDIKLLAATGLWFDLQGALLVLMCVLIAGGILAILLIAFRSWRRSAQTKEGVKLRKRGGVIPYGVAICAGGIFGISLAAGWG
jgi:prepilin peptidase CpaA